MKRINIVKFKSNPQSWQNEMQRITENQVFNQRYYMLYICTKKLSNLTIQYITKLHLNKTKTFKHVTWIAAVNWNDVRSLQYVVLCNSAKLKYNKYKFNQFMATGNFKCVPSKSLYKPMKNCQI